MFCDHSRLRRRHKTAGQDVSLEYRRHARAFHQARPDTLNFVRTKFFCNSVRGQDSQSAGVCTHRKAAAPGGLANASRPHSKLCPRSPLYGEFFAENPALVTTYARNQPPFTPVHSHAPAPESSGAFFRVLTGERCRKRPGRGRNALRASQGVRPRDVMVNAKIWAVIQIVAAPRRGPLLVELMGLEPMTDELEVHCSPS